MKWVVEERMEGSSLFTLISDLAAWTLLPGAPIAAELVTSFWLGTGLRFLLAWWFLPLELTLLPSVPVVHNLLKHYMEMTTGPVSRV